MSAWWDVWEQSDEWCLGDRPFYILVGILALATFVIGVLVLL